ncbi:Hypothetical protein PFR_JS9-2_1481 [Propionibacterium freudenreichii]|nr:Hypothetical protein PFR_JS9-1_1483 [Propionibacterium freudenreichii]SCQ69326.1 Hypothetical protein PFR_JS9-2_1481 [Propionibacterium freudenreichii]
MEHSLKERLGAGVRARREASKLSQEKYAPTIGLTVRYLAGIERGERNLTIDSIDSIAQRMGVDPVALLRLGDRQLAKAQPKGGSSPKSSASES